MKLDTSLVNDVVVINVAGELTYETVARFTEAVDAALSEQRRDFVIDLKHVTRVDSKGLEAITALQRRCEDQLGMACFCSEDPTLLKILEMTRLSKRLALFSCREEALAGIVHAT